ncbi:MAG: oxygen-independent coproporphyrinogen-3 oxidase [Pseudomonadales bacterium]
MDALLVDLAEEMPSVWGRTISTVFIGGGTPSLFSAKAIDQLMSGIRALTGLHPTAEVTMEANPGTFEQQRFKDYRDSGINRLSIGIQSFNTKALKALGRVHSADEAIRAVGIAQKAGFDKINLDLMFGLPEQTLEGAMDDLDQALSLGTTHLSCYELTLEPNTLFARFPPKLPSDDLRADMQNAIVKKLREHQFERYEISAYAKSESKTLKGDGAGSASRQRANHNVNYWQFGDYLGIGAGAHAKISSANTGEIVRQWKHKHPKQYLNAKTQSDRIGGRSLIPVQETGLEFMMNALRLIEGFPIPLFEQHTGVSMMPWQRAIESATEKGLLEQKGLNLRATPTGINWLNSTLELFLEGAPSSPGRNAESKNVPAARRYPIIPLKISNK